MAILDAPIPVRAAHGCFLGAGAGPSCIPQRLGKQAPKTCGLIVPLSLYVEALMPHVIVFGDGAYKEMIKVK